MLVAFIFTQKCSILSIIFSNIQIYQNLNVESISVKYLASLRYVSSSFAVGTPKIPFYDAFRIPQV